MTEISPRAGAWLTAQRIMEETGLSPAELAALPLDEYARLTGRPTLGQIAEDATAYADLRTPPGRPRQAAPQAPQPATARPGIDFTDPAVIANMSREELLHYRAEIHAANGIGPARANTGSLSGGVGRHHLVESGVDRSNAISTRAGTDQAIQAAQQADHDRLGNWIASQRGAVGHQGVGPVRGEPLGFTF